MKLSPFFKLTACGLALVLAACGQQGAQTAASGSSAGASTERVIRFGSDAAYPPFESTAPNGDIVGFDIDIAKAMCEEIKAKCTFVNQAWEGIIPALLAKKYDVIASSMSVTPERQEVVLFTKMIWSSPSLFVAKTGTVQDTTAQGLKGVDLGVQQGTVQDTYATKYFAGANIKRYKTMEDAISDLGTGRLKVVFSDGGVVAHLVDGSEDRGFQLIGDPVPNSADAAIFGAGTAFAVRKEDQALADELNQAFDTIRANGTYQKIAEQYFKFDIYGQAE